ncbi:MAG: aminotransferase class V-fold PLP-dependent enzyme, partial [Planctomycetaceae bacterium]|nr:aminotransferase class V-fold PLP-dependent enzyme [Planctomycetaceae bacterium]
AADGHKWLLGPEGAGLLYLRRANLERLRPLGVGWHSSLHAGDYSRREFALKPSAERYEGGSANLLGIAGLAASLELLSHLGPERLGERLLEVTDEACWRLTALGAAIVSSREPGRASGIVAFELPERDPLAVRKYCLEQRVVLSCRDGRLRISPHAYTNSDDLERLCDALETAP